MTLLEVVVSRKRTQTRMWHCEKRFLLDFGVINTTDDDCEQQVSSVALRLQQLTAAVVRQPSPRLTTAAVWRQVEQEAVFIFAHILCLKPDYPPRKGASVRVSACGNRISDANAIIALDSNCVSVLLRLQRTDGRTKDQRQQPSHLWPLRPASNNSLLNWRHYGRTSMIKFFFTFG